MAGKRGRGGGRPVGRETPGGGRGGRAAAAAAAAGRIGSKGTLATSLGQAQPQESDPGLGQEGGKARERSQ
eukprot:436604-Hanusia_phi.AAC.1